MVEQQAQIEVLQEQLSKWEALTKTPAWELLCKYADGQTQRRVSELLHGEDGKVNLERLRGEAAGIELFKQIPQIEIDRIRNDIDSLRKQAETENETT